MYVILQPHSNTNRSSKYRVVKRPDWTRYMNGETITLECAGESDTYGEARELRDRLNNQ
jgi:hypothetical protein